MFPRIAVHTGNSVVLTNAHPRWKGTVVLQHNETTTTILRHGNGMTKASKLRHPVLSTYQGNCLAKHWEPFSSVDPQSELFGQKITDGLLPVPVVVPPPTQEVQETVAH